MKNFISDSQKIGKLGEDIACKFLMKHGFSILERNYTKKWGEIDIVSKKGGKYYFIEVKSKSVETLDNVSYETNRPEDNMHFWKLKRLSKTVETYLIQNRIGNTPWQFDLLVVYMDLQKKTARVRVVENVVL